MKIILLFFVSIIIIFSGCGEQLDLSQFPTNQTPGVIGDTVYIPQSPAFTGFNQPVDILIGNEPLIYVADKMNNRIVQLDISGGLIGYSVPILKPKKIAQDKNYDLLVIATIIDTIPPNILDSVDVVYRFKLRNNNGLISNLQPTIAFRSNQATPVPGDHGNFTGLAAFPDNYYLVSRSGPNNSSQIDPDNAFFRINKFDNTVPVPQRLSGFEIQGQGLMSLLEVSSIVTIPYSYTDFIYTQTYNDEVFKVQWVVYDEIEQIYTPKFTPSGNVDLLRNGLFSRPEAATIDSRNNIYVIDSEKDSLYKFTGAGKLLPESFGGEGASDTKFLHPMGVAFFYKTLYICDTGNNRILRFILSTDIN